MITKCKALGIDGKVIKWVEAFLKDRKQRVILSGCSSGWSEVVSGVPQGSVMGPVLFIMFINDMPVEVSNFISLFADDAKLFGESTDNIKSQSIQNDLTKLQDWSNKWDLHFNESKCKTLYLGNNNTKRPYTMSTANVEWADKEGLHAAQIIIFSMHNHCYHAILVKIGLNSFKNQYHKLFKDV